MKKVIYIACALFFSFASPVAQAELIDIDWDLNGNIKQLSLVDTLTQMEWLDVSFTYNVSYNSVKNGLTVPGSIYDGFRFATQAEVLQLWSNAGISNTQYVAVDNGEFAAVKALADRLGTTPLGETSLPGSHVLGMVEGGSAIDSNLRWAMEISYGTDGVRSRSSAEHYTWDIAIGDHHYGSYLVRSSVVPVPAAIWLFISGGLGLLAVSRRKMNWF